METILQELQKRARLLALRLEKRQKMMLLEKNKQKAYEDIRKGIMIKPGGLVGYLHAQINALTQAIEDEAAILDFTLVPCDANIEGIARKEEEMAGDFTIVKNIVDMPDDGMDAAMCSYEDLTGEE